MNMTNRRAFLRNAVGALAAPAIAGGCRRKAGEETRTPQAPAPPPTDRIRVGVIGLGPQGFRNLSNFLANKDFRVVAVCDVNGERRAKGAAKVKEVYGEACAASIDFRAIIDDPAVDAVVISIGERWHAPMSMMAARAGKDIYCEKPACLSMEELYALRETLRRHKVVYQCGTQRRNQWAYRYAADLARSGRLGKLHTLYAQISRFGWNSMVPPAEPLPPREKMDWDLWLGPAPEYAYNAGLAAGKWRRFRGLSGCGIEEIGAHGTDICQFARNADDTQPVLFRHTPEGLVAEYADGIIMPFRTPPNGNKFKPVFSARFDGSDGWFYVDDGGNIEASDKSLVADYRQERTDHWQDLRNWTGHVGDFAKAIRGRTAPASNIEVTTRSMSTLLVGAMAIETGKDIRWDPVKETFVGETPKSELLTRSYRAPWDGLVPLDKRA
jgi:predicted dehydrogenase